MNPAPYVLGSNPLLSPVPISTIGYMDDTNLVASSLDGIRCMLDTAQGFYALNNTKINFDKAIFSTNRNPHNVLADLPSAPSAYTFHLSQTSFSLTPLPMSASFRFLGVWFSLSSSQSFVY